MQSIGETEILIETMIVGKVRVQNISALDALRPRIGLLDVSSPAISLQVRAHE